ncbi:hypothetical protein ADK70_12600 [Streptomyces rimosus subsp. pseudoverticillatus]|uniref:hypothetical protein n=1 Tax=Streptomyces rimosus TaxID=1927 RepID=UPI0006B29E9F|nr:hypothetical protein [Streptomyces rimosus]KOT94509.1 hypothetical protein ADK70_12600 [Streptomyces rimosus subsp. pseudoverticillatus]
MSTTVPKTSVSVASPADNLIPFTLTPAADGLAGAPLYATSIDSSAGRYIDGTPHQVLVAQISYDDETGRPELAFDAGGEDWVHLTPDELRAYVARVRDHLTRLHAMADQFEAITSGEAGWAS